VAHEPDSGAPPGRTGSDAAVDLFWIPLGAGAHVVRLSGRSFEALSAAARRRPRRDLYHSALEVVVPRGRFTIEMTPVPRSTAPRGAVLEGPVGSAWLGRTRIFRYEVRCWPDGRIPDADAAVDSPVTVLDDAARAQRLLDLVPRVPSAVWGRDDQGLGEMWNSNSVVSWLLTCSGADVDGLRPPTGGRAPGWDAGVVLGRRMTAAGAVGD
jgi:hypothetical protein